MRKTFVIVINGKPPYPAEAIKSYLGGIGDWMLFSWNVYFVRSESSATDIRVGVRALIDQSFDILVAKMNLAEYSGWLSKTAIDWIKEDNGKPPQPRLL